MSSRISKCVVAMAAIAAGLGFARPASAVLDYLRMDVNGATLQASSVVADYSTFTGTLTFQADANTQLNDLFLADTITGESNQNIAAEPAQVSGSLTVLNGLITGGAISIAFDNPGLPDNNYSFSLVSGTGNITLQTAVPTPTYKFITDTNAGLLATNALAGIDVGPFTGAPREGALTLTNFRPNANGSYDDVQMELTIFVPEPASLGLICTAGAGVLARRRRA
jgi:hypothetical protein